MYKHIIVTRYGIGIASEKWYECKIDLFKSVTLPSIASQARDNLFWMIAIDSSIPSKALKELRAAVEAYSFIHLVAVDPLEQQHMLHGGFTNIYERCQDYLLGNGLIEDPSEHIITSLIDDDDAWHRRVIECIDRHVEANAERLLATEGDSKRGYLLRHSTGMFMTFEHGILWDIANGLYDVVQQPSQSMSVFIFARFSSNVSVCTVRHGSWPTYTNSVGFETHVIGGQNTEPMWIYVRHPRTISQIAGPTSGYEVTNEVLQRFASDFSIDAKMFCEFIETSKRAEMRASGAPTTKNSNYLIFNSE